MYSVNLSVVFIFIYIRSCFLWNTGAFKDDSFTSMNTSALFLWLSSLFVYIVMLNSFVFMMSSPSLYHVFAEIKPIIIKLVIYETFVYFVWTAAVTGQCVFRLLPPEGNLRCYSHLSKAESFTGAAELNMLVSSTTMWIWSEIS